jgi:hypothetical protein
MIAYVELAWLDRLSRATLYRYELPIEGFEGLDDAGMWIARTPVEPLRVEAMDDLPGALREHEVDLRPVESLLF